MSQLLAGVRVLDLTNVISGPLCSLQLAMLGADVIKIEAPARGDMSRKWGEAGLGERLMGGLFVVLNAGKRSISLNLKHPEGKAIFKRMVEQADVVIENFRPGAMKRLGLDYDVLRKINPDIIYCAISGFGQEGPLANRPSYDQIIQGFSGLMSLTGDSKTAPQKAGYVVCDAMAAIVGAFAIVAALYRRSQTGQGEMIDVSMLDASLTTMAAWTYAEIVNCKETPKPAGNWSAIAAPSGTFRTGDGTLNIVCNEDKQFVALCKVLELVHLAEDPRFSSRRARAANRFELGSFLEERLAIASAAEWEMRLTEAGVPVGPILSLQEMLKHPHVVHRKLVKDLGYVPAAECTLHGLRLGFHLASGLPDVTLPPPALGEHTHELLEELGITGAKAASLRDAGTI
jgi:CoA:oxalate CoA-transferase